MTRSKGEPNHEKSPDEKKADPDHHRLLLLTFRVPASSHAAGVLLVPAAGLAVWGVTLVAAGAAAIFEGDSHEAEETRANQEALKTPQVSDSDAGRGALELQPDEG